MITYNNGPFLERRIVKLFFSNEFYVYLSNSRFGHPFEIPLLIQSIIMTIAMLAMVRLCVRVRYHSMNNIEPYSQHSFFGNFFLYDSKKHFFFKSRSRPYRDPEFKC